MGFPRLRSPPRDTAKPTSLRERMRSPHRRNRTLPVRESADSAQNGGLPGQRVRHVTFSLSAGPPACRADVHGIVDRRDGRRCDQMRPSRRMARRCSSIRTLSTRRER